MGSEIVIVGHHDGVMVERVTFGPSTKGAEIDAVYGAGSEAARMTRAALGLLPVWIRIDVKTTSPNAKGLTRSLRGAHAQARRNKTERAIAAQQTRFQTLRHKIRYPATIRIVRVAPSAGLDADNLQSACKRVRDGITDGLGFSNDSDPSLVWKYGQRRGRRGEYAIEVEIISIDA